MELKPLKMVQCFFTSDFIWKHHRNRFVNQKYFDCQKWGSGLLQTACPQITQYYSYILNNILSFIIKISKCATVWGWSLCLTPHRSEGISCAPQLACHHHVFLWGWPFLWGWELRFQGQVLVTSLRTPGYFAIFLSIIWYHLWAVFWKLY